MIVRSEVLRDIDAARRERRQRGRQVVIGRQKERLIVHSTAAQETKDL